MKWKIIMVLVIGAIALDYRLRAMACILDLDCRCNAVEPERVAASLVEGRGFSDPYPERTGPTAHVAPLYPVFLAGLYRVFGDYQTSTGIFAVQAITIVESIGVLLLMPVLAKALGLSPVAGWLAALLMAWLPGHRDYEVTGHFEHVLAGLLLVGVVTVFALGRARQWPCRHIFSVAGLTALLALGAPNLILVPISLFVVEFITCAARLRRRVLCAAGVVVLCCTLASLPWAIRNYCVLGGFVPLRSNLGLELAIGNRDGAIGETYSPGFYDVHPFGSSVERNRLRSVGELAYMKMKRAEACDWIAGHPGTFAWLILRRAMLMWFTVDEQWHEMSFELHRKSRVYGLMGFLVLLELAWLIRQRHASAWLLVAIIGSAIFPYLLTHVEMRYRYPIVGLFALLSCNALVAMAQAAWKFIAERAGSDPVAAERSLQPRFPDVLMASLQTKCRP